MASTTLAALLNQSEWTEVSSGLEMQASHQDKLLALNVYTDMFTVVAVIG